MIGKTISAAIRAGVSVACLVATCQAGDLTLTAAGFPNGDPGNGTFTLVQSKNADGKPIPCWCQQGKEGWGWRAGYSDAAGLIRVTYQRTGVLMEYNAIIPNAPSGATVPFKGSDPRGLGPIPMSVVIAP